jgi:hypothetical protein
MYVCLYVCVHFDICAQACAARCRALASRLVAMQMPVSTMKRKGLERSCEAARASAMAAHASAQLSLPWHKEVARLLRVAEAVSRTAAALLDGAACELRAAPPPHATAAGGPAPAKPSRSARRRARKRIIPEDFAMGSITVVTTPGDAADAGPVPGPVGHLAARAPAAAPRELRLRPSRERSPRRPLLAESPERAVEGEQVSEAVLPFPPGPCSSASGHVRSSKLSVLAEGKIMLIRGLVRRSDLNDTRCRLLSLDKTTGRWAIVLEDTGENIKVLPANLMECLFAQGFRSVPGVL